MKKTNKEKFEALDTKKKLEYVWDYYKWHIFGGIFGVVAIIYIIYFINRPDPPVYSADVLVSGVIQVDPTDIKADQLEMQEAVDGGIYTMATDWDTMDQMTMVNDQLIMIKIQTKECDLMVIPESKHEKYLTNQDFELFHKLDEIPELDEVLEMYSDQLVKGTTPVDGDEHVYGIRVNELKNVESVVLGEDLVISMMNPPKNTEAAIELIKYLLIEE